MIQGLDHVTINTGNLAATEKFYTEVVGLELAPRPDLGVPGIWLKESGAPGPAIVHVLAVDGKVPDGTKARAILDHVAFHAKGFDEARGRIETYELPWCGNVIEGFGLWQLMFYDPNSVLIELNFKAKDETTPTPVIPDDRRMTLENFFERSAYKIFLEKSMLKGSCVCGKVAYEIDCEPGPIVHCHCETCRKTHGSAFSSVMPISKDCLKWVRGEDLLLAHESSPGKFRRFCSKCGSHVIAERPAEEVVLLRLGCLDTPIDGDVKAHIWRSDGASWYDPKDEIPELEKGVG